MIIKKAALRRRLDGAPVFGQHGVGFRLAAEHTGPRIPSPAKLAAPSGTRCPLPSDELRARSAYGRSLCPTQPNRSRLSVSFLGMSV